MSIAIGLSPFAFHAGIIPDVPERWQNRGGTFIRTKSARKRFWKGVEGTQKIDALIGGNVIEFRFLFSGVVSPTRPDRTSGDFFESYGRQLAAKKEGIIIMHI
jgi:hypothetical protein